jgi:D-cysteine desulfhydrase family pyridoxal phosphate-dependent enzyme
MPTPSMDGPKSKLAGLPRFDLAHLPTPLVEASRLRAALGGPRRCPRILLKRDDLTGLAFGGNKARKLEFLVGDALQAGATALVTTGAVQSNHARMTAAAARAAGMRCSLVLTRGAGAPELQGNLLIDRLLGAEVHFIDPNPDPRLATGGDEEKRVAEVVEDLRERGERPYVIPIGGSSPIGALGYVAGALELLAQLAKAGLSPARLYYASGSRGTAAGIVAGARLFRAPYRPIGIAVSGGEPEKRVRAARIANDAAALLDVEAGLAPGDFETDQGYIGEGYGIPTDGCLEALRLLALEEGILLDPVYTAKAMHGLIDHVRRGLVDPDGTVIFLHTGGTPALFAFGERLGAALGAS